MVDEVLQSLLADSDTGSGLTPYQRQQLLDVVEEIGNVNDSCADCRITSVQLMEALDQDPDLDRDLQMAQGRFNAEVRRRIKDLALNGYEVPVIGGKDKDKVVANQTIPDGKALEILAKMFFSKDMAQYTRAAVITKDLGKKEKGDTLDLDRLTRVQRTAFDDLLRVAAGEIEQVEDKTA